MTVDNFVKASGFKVIALPSPEKEIDGVYIGDLLSWVMGRAEAGNLWITIMSNINVVAVASLSEVSSVILTEGVTLEEEVLRVASEKGVNVISTTLSSYDASIRISEILK